jgi:glycosyltransferase involved in cell wall biosynthesis
MSETRPPEGHDGFAIVDRRYLHVTPTPTFADADGSLWLDRLWHQDLVAHPAYLPRFLNCAPLLPRGSEPDLVRYDPSTDPRIEFRHLPPQSSFLRALLHLPRTAFVLWRSIGRADIVHSGIGGWPYPLGWLANPIALLRRKRLVIIVESDWKLGRPDRRKWRHRFLDMDPIRDRLARWACRRADLALFTNPAYRDALAGARTEGVYVTPAVWIDEGDLLDDRAAELAWSSKPEPPPRFLFAGRLTESKGVGVLLDALAALDARGVELRVDVIGEGDRREDCRQAAVGMRSVRLEVLDPVPYGPLFFEVVRRCRALLVPSRSDEQPRVVFDAYSQAVPVIASETGGLRSLVRHGETGWLVPVADAAALAAALERACGSLAELRAMGRTALRETRGVTHEAMHRWRSHLIARHCA